MHAEFNGIKFTDADVVNIDEWADDNSRYGIHAYLIHDHGFTVCIVFARSEQDALDEAVDAGKLDSFQLDPNDPAVREDYMHLVTTGDGAGPDGAYWDFREDASVAFLGNASEPFDIEGLDIVTLPNPKRSFVASFNARATAE